MGKRKKERATGTRGSRKGASDCVRTLGVGGAGAAFFAGAGVGAGVGLAAGAFTGAATGAAAGVGIGASAANGFATTFFCFSAASVTTRLAATPVRGDGRLCAVWVGGC